jgi:hypothetical protein
MTSSIKIPPMNNCRTIIHNLIPVLSNLVPALVLTRSQLEQIATHHFC